MGKPFSRRQLFSLNWGRSKKQAIHSATDPSSIHLPNSSRTITPIPVAVLNQSKCIAYRSGFCDNCYERCPIPGAIILSQGKPTIDKNLCDGCGICAQVCPSPSPAISIVSPGDIGRMK